MTIFGELTYKLSMSLYLSIGSVLDFLVLKNAAQRTSQRLEWTSGARVMIIFGRSITRSYDRSIARSHHSWENRSSLL